MTVRTRFAPSPTGHVHIGNIRAAIYTWLFARHEGGQFLLRIEDTDRERSTPEAIETVLEALEWLGLSYDEDPVYQSARQEAHLAVVEKLLSEGKAYREDKGGKGECVIFRMPGTDMSFHDEIKGTLQKAAVDMKDFVIVRSNGTPVFHLANVVDDIHMAVTHIIRGDDHIENTYRHVALYDALDAEAPKFAHLPMIVNHHGKPYSKRDGDAYVGEFREREYLAEALFNYLALLGWSPGGDREIMSRDEMVELFDLQRVQSKPAQFDPRKLEWMNGEYMRALPKDVLEKSCRQVLQEQGLWNESISPEYFRRVLDAMGERIHFYSDIANQGGFFFTEDFQYDDKAVKKRLKKEGALEKLGALKDRFAELDQFNAETSEACLRAFAEELEISPGQLIHPVRVAVSGLGQGPSMFEMLDVLGRERVLARINRALERFAD